MRKIILILLATVVSFAVNAQNAKDINSVKKNLQDKVVTPLKQKAANLDVEINDAQILYDKLKNRSYKIVSSNSENSSLDEYLGNFQSLKELFAGKDKGIDFVLEQIEKADGSNRKNAYLLVIGMKKSLDNPYDETSNDRFIKDAKIFRNEILPKHLEEYDKLVSQINDYNYYMFELARLFVAADEDKYSKTAEQLVKDEDAPYLLDVPYTKDMLELYINSKKNEKDLSPEKKAELKAACSDAFPDF